MSRDLNKLIMFDYGGIIEKYSTKEERIYDYRDVLVDAVIYATGITIPMNCNYDEFRYDILRRLTESQYTKKEFTGWKSEKERMSYLADCLHDLSCLPFGDWEEAAIKYITYCKSHMRLIPLNYKMIELEKQLKERCLVGGMTNIGTIWHPMFCEVTDCIDYDFVFASCTAGYVKPDPRAYEYVERISGLKGESILLIDDNYDNIKAAVEYGWCGYWVPDNDIKGYVESVTNDFITGNESAMWFLRSIPIEK